MAERIWQFQVFTGYTTENIFDKSWITISKAEKLDNLLLRAKAWTRKNDRLYRIVKARYTDTPLYIDTYTSPRDYYYRLGKEIEILPRNTNLTGTKRAEAIQAQIIAKYSSRLPKYVLGKIGQNKNAKKFEEYLSFTPPSFSDVLRFSNYYEDIEKFFDDVYVYDYYVATLNNIDKYDIEFYSGKNTNATAKQLEDRWKQGFYRNIVSAYTLPRGSYELPYRGVATLYDLSNSVNPIYVYEFVMNFISVISNSISEDDKTTEEQLFASKILKEFVKDIQTCLPELIENNNKIKNNIGI